MGHFLEIEVAVQVKELVIQLNKLQNHVIDMGLYTFTLHLFMFIFWWNRGVVVSVETLAGWGWGFSPRG